MVSKGSNSRIEKRRGTMTHRVDHKGRVNTEAVITGIATSDIHNLIRSNTIGSHPTGLCMRNERGNKGISDNKIDMQRAINEENKRARGAIEHGDTTERGTMTVRNKQSDSRVINTGGDMNIDRAGTKDNHRKGESDSKCINHKAVSKLAVAKHAAKIHITRDIVWHRERQRPDIRIQRLSLDSGIQDFSALS